MADRYPGYDVMAKRHTPSWNEKTRQVIDQRLTVPREPRFLDAGEFATLSAIAARITPQPADRAPIPVAALVDDKLLHDRQDGYREAAMPRDREAWQRGLRAIDAEAQSAHGAAFRDLPPTQQDALLRRVESGDAHHAAWDGMPPKTFFKHRLLTDIVHAYWSHPTAWNEIGWGGPASPRGYVRMGYDERDAWEAAQASAADDHHARRKNARVG
ncbi:MAG: gluconate 2-dehydrogenase subunit 3 family protein [Acidisphaera sp.]|nr:gluconate 2-dehydrogenase subunit 3 family protein [Acidisphaera sp.]MBV9812711.1 gluconate 2-dehydrogenase subunit 3 family protein [Acetobacteraceae bacterium]